MKSLGVGERHAVLRERTARGLGEGRAVGAREGVRQMEMAVEMGDGVVFQCNTRWKDSHAPRLGYAGQICKMDSEGILIVPAAEARKRATPRTCERGEIRVPLPFPASLVYRHRVGEAQAPRRLLPRSDRADWSACRGRPCRRERAMVAKVAAGGRARQENNEQILIGVVQNFPGPYARAQCIGIGPHGAAADSCQVLGTAASPIGQLRPGPSLPSSPGYSHGLACFWSGRN